MQVADRHFALGAIGATFGSSVRQAAASDPALQNMLVKYTPQGANLIAQQQAAAFRSAGATALLTGPSPSEERRLILNGLRRAEMSLGYEAGSLSTLDGLGACNPDVQSCMPPASVKEKKGIKLRADAAHAELDSALKKKVAPRAEAGASSGQPGMFSQLLGGIAGAALGLGPGAAGGAGSGKGASAPDINIVAADPITGACVAFASEVGKVCGQLLAEYARKLAEELNCGVNGYDYCNANEAMTAIEAAIARPYSYSSNRFLIDHLKKGQAYNSEENRRWRWACDDDRRGQISTKCEDTFGFDDSINGAPFLANESVLNGRLRDLAADKGARDALGLLDEAQRTYINADAQKKTLLTWVGAQTKASVLDPMIVQNDPGFEIYSDGQKRELYDAIQRRIRELTGVVATASNNLPLILGIGALGLGGFFVWKKTRG
jgi:hypothetical protein